MDTRANDVGAARGAAVLYVLAAQALIPAFGNHGLWLAFILFMEARGETLALHDPALVRRVAARG